MPRDLVIRYARPQFSDHTNFARIRGTPMVGHFVVMVLVRVPAQLPATPFRARSGARFFRAAGDTEAYYQHLWEGESPACSSLNGRLAVGEYRH